ncbi:hypothetical protein QIT30_gp16 [Saccharolobus solfataricus rod-shaped virus 1]|uniref:Uncharacterized protein n=1 Tax=Saccharolobus solfataricus rod-shaped virus 1 TaxID=2730619 RepID=A0A6M3VYH1_SSRV1|nr:hypothetical protein QIT30_gp16 [Saccharolobus solfataricus rod-shaped virus 1]QJF12292.1 hypothetical protein SSRV1_gp16 [Saccharolobus solfataricus rod-shaped virus 1]
MSEATLILTTISTSTTIILSILTLYYKIKQMFREAVKEIVKQELDNLVREIAKIKEKQDEQQKDIEYLKQEIEEIKKKIEKL